MRNWANLDILRSSAVLIVMLGHLQMYTGHDVWNKWTGLTGVCLFFVHTCLVLMWSLEREPHTLRFYVRRAFRLYPLWLIVLAAVVILRVPIAPPAAPGFAYLYPHWKEILANALLVMKFDPVWHSHCGCVLVAAVRGTDVSVAAGALLFHPG